MPDMFGRDARHGRAARRRDRLASRPPGRLWLDRGELDKLIDGSNSISSRHCDQRFDDVRESEPHNDGGTRG